ncbi:MAG: hypothetical protein FWF77_01620 [Defluviitaleaceae bacterium]|nr:hypothetical protein [Defluviitaleaceae bacterium]
MKTQESLARVSEFAKLLAHFESLPPEQRIALLYYTKGRLEAAADENHFARQTEAS